MSDIERKLLDLGEQLDPNWDQARVELGLSSLHARRRRRRIVRAGMATLAAVTLVAIGVGTTFQYDNIAREDSLVTEAPSSEALAAAAATDDEASPAKTPTPPAEPRALDFGDGSRAVLLTPETKLVAHTVSSEQIVLNLEVGGVARFEVIPSQSRSFVVNAGGVKVEVMGTAFTVRHASESVGVEVHRGRVAVTPPKKNVVVLTTNQTLKVSLKTESIEPMHAAARPSAPKTSTPPPEGPRSGLVTNENSQSTERHEEELDESPEAKEPGWQELAEQGQYKAAYQALVKEEPQVRSPEESFAAADVARLSGHPEQTLTHLRSVIDNFPDDPRSALAAFTLGRILLQDLGRPREAAEAFAHARVLRPKDSLAEDSLAREVEAWFRANEKALARKRATQYLDTYPDGKRRDSVLRYGAPDG